MTELFDQFISEVVRICPRDNGTIPDDQKVVHSRKDLAVIFQMNDFAFG